MRKSLTRLLSVFLAVAMTAGCSFGSATVAQPNSSSITEGETGWGEVITSAGTVDEEKEFEVSDATEVNIRASHEGMVLLKNENAALPLTSDDTVAFFGSSQLFAGRYERYGYRIGGAGSGAVYGSPGTTPIAEFRKKADAGKFTLYDSISALYEAAYELDEYALAEDNGAYFPSDEAISAAKSAGVNKVVYIFSRLEGEAGTEESFLPTNGEFEVTGVPDDAPEPGQYYLSANEEAHLKKLRENFDTVIVVANTGDLMDTTWAKYGIDFDDSGEYTQVVDAALFSWYGGLKGMQALADILVGDANPSGKLSQTAAKSVDDYPTTDGFFEKEFTNYYEDVFVGYRYFETFDPDYEKVNYEFGYGLSYTTFDISDIAYTAAGDYINVSAKITNTGDVSGKEVFQVYFSAPQMGEGEALLSKPAKELAGYTKTKLLEPGESETVTVSFPIKDMSSYDDTGVTGVASAYVLEAGDYEILAGNSVKNVELAGTYTVSELTVVEQLTSQAAPYDLDKRLLADGTYESLELREKPVEEYKPNYGLPIYGTIHLEGESFDTILSVGAPGSEKFTSSQGTLYSEPVYLDANDNAPDFDYTTTDREAYAGSQLCQMHVTVKQAVYPINVGKAGYYQLHIRAARSGVSTDFLGIYINGEKVDYTFNLPRTSESGYFNHVDFYFDKSKAIYLPAGKTLIAFENKRIGFPNVDFFEFIPIPDEEAPEEVVSVTIEGEDYDTTAEGAENITAEDNKWGPQLATNIVWASENVVDYDNSTWVDHPGYCVSGIASGETAVYNVNAPEGGMYKVSMIACRPTSVIADLFNIKVGDTLHEFDVAFPQTGGQEVYFKYIDHDFDDNVVIPLNKGDNTVTLCFTGSGILIDSITFTKVDAPIKVEAESYNETESVGTSFKKEANGKGAQLATNLVMTNPFVVDFDNTTWEAYPADNLGTCVSSIAANERLVYDVNVPAAGNYIFSMRACRPTRYHVNFMDIEVNGVQNVYHVNFPQTGLDETKYFRYIDNSFDNDIILTLNEGSNKITLMAKTVMPLVDFFTLTPTKLTPDYVVTFEGESLDTTASNGAGFENLNTSTGKLAPNPVVSGTAVDVDATVWYNLSYAGAKNLSKLGNTSGNTAVYHVNAPIEGTYGLKFRGARSNAYARAGFMSIDVNGTKYDFPETSFPQTGAAGVYFNFIDVDYTDTVQVPLVKGENTITFINNGSFPNVDFFIFEYIPPIEEETEESYVREGDEPVVYPDGVVTFNDVKEGINTIDELVAQMNISELASFAVLSENLNSAQRSGVGGNDAVQDKFKIPVGSTVDGPSGPTTKSNSLGMASGMTIGCSWNVDIAADFGTIVGKLCELHGSTDFWLAPGMNIQRNPLCGRNFEYFSEDPLITGLCGAAITEKMQKYGSGVAVKHFAVNNKETNRGGNDSRVSERALREIYLRGFEILVKDADPVSMMTGYNLVNGYECCENYELLVGIPRNEWGFDGMYMTDWGKTPSLYKLVKGGCNTNMGNYENMWDSEVLVDQYIAENLTREELETNAKYVIGALLRLDISDTETKSQDYTHTLSVTQPTTVEAEHYSTAYISVNIENRATASGGKNLGTFNTVDTDGRYLSFATYEVVVPRDTTFDVSIALSSYWAVKANVYVDGKLTDLAILNAASTEDWAKFVTFEMGTITLTKGTHKIRLEPVKATTSSSEGFNPDCFVFTPHNSDNVSMSISIEREYTDGMGVKYSAADYGNELYDSGMYITISDANGNVVAELTESDAIYTVAEGEKTNAVLGFGIALENGSYTALIEKNGYVEKTVSFTIDESTTTIDIDETLVGGDFKGSFTDKDGDGVVDIDDYLRLLRAFGNNVAKELCNIVDVNEDGIVNMLDLAVVKTSLGE